MNWEFRFANFTFKSLKIKMSSSPNSLFFYFNFNPMLKTFYMNTTTWTYTFARIKQKVFFWVSVFKANFTIITFNICQLRCKFHRISITHCNFMLWNSWIHYSSKWNFTNKVLYSSKFNNLTNISIENNVLSMLPESFNLLTTMNGSYLISLLEFYSSVLNF